VVPLALSAAGERGPSGACASERRALPWLASGAFPECATDARERAAEPLAKCRCGLAQYLGDLVEGEPLEQAQAEQLGLAVAQRVDDVREHRARCIAASQSIDVVLPSVDRRRRIEIGAVARAADAGRPATAGTSDVDDAVLQTANEARLVGDELAFAHVANECLEHARCHLFAIAVIDAQAATDGEAVRCTCQVVPCDAGERFRALRAGRASDEVGESATRLCVENWHEILLDRDTASPLRRMGGLGPWSMGLVVSCRSADCAS
jgi:hypothetical protein